MIRWAVLRPAVVWAITVAVLLVGAVSITRLTLATKTTVELPRLMVTTSWPGASPDLIEADVTAPLEALARGVRGVRRTSSRSRDGTSTLTLELEATADVQMVRLAVLERIDIWRREMPDGVIGPVVSNFVPAELEEAPLIRVELTGPFTKGALQQIADRLVVPTLVTLPGVAGVQVVGGTVLSVAVTYDSRRLSALGVLPSALYVAIQNAHVEAALGERHLGVFTRNVVLRGRASTIPELATLPIRSGSGRVFRLDEVASIRPDENSNGLFYRINGRSALALVVTRAAGADAMRVARTVRVALASVATRLPEGVTLHVQSDSSREIVRDLRDLFVRGCLAVLAVLCVLWSVFRSARSVGVVFLSALVSISGTALGLYLLQIPTNLLSLAGVAMGIGILVQDGVIVVDHLERSDGTPAGLARAAERAAPMVLSATLATIVVLLPFLYLQGDARVAFVPFASTFAMALGWSALTSLFVVPAIAGTHGVRPGVRWRVRRYRRVLAGALRLRWVVLATLSGGLGVLTWTFIAKVPRQEFSGYGADAWSTVTASIRFPQGTDPESLDRAVREFEMIALARPGVEEVVSQSISAASAVMQVRFSRSSSWSAAPGQLEDDLIRRAVLIGGASVGVFGRGPPFSTGASGSGSTVSIFRVLGYSHAGVESTAADLRARISQIRRARVIDVSSGAAFGDDHALTVTLKPSRMVMAHFGVTARDFGATIQREISGAANVQWRENGSNEVNVSIKASGASNRTLRELQEVRVPVASGAPVRVADLSEVATQPEAGTIVRENQRYMRYVAFEFRGPSELAERTSQALLRNTSVPPGYAVEDAERNGERRDHSDRGLWLVFAIGVALLTLSVAVVFDSVFAGVVALMSVPVALGGVMTSYLACNATFTREAAVGVILVVGLSVHQAILFVGAVLRRRRESGTQPMKRFTLQIALRSAVEELRVIMTVTAVTLASVIPLAIGAPAGSLHGAIALATVGGTIAGAFGALLVLPALASSHRQ